MGGLKRCLYYAIVIVSLDAVRHQADNEWEGAVVLKGTTWVGKWKVQFEYALHPDSSRAVRREP